MAPLTEIPLQDVSNQLNAVPALQSDNDVPEWERMDFPFPVLQPSTVNEQPTPWKVNAGAITSFPKRLRNPPTRPSIPQLKRFTIIPEYDIPLSDILEDKHASPLSLREFEEYLLYVERSVENLYFCLWFKQYTNEYNDSTERPFSDLEPSSSSTFHTRPRSAKPTPPNESLAKSFQHARELFFNQDSQYEVNVTDEMIEPVRHLLRPTPAGPARRRKEAWEDDSEDDSHADENPLAVSKDLFVSTYARPRDMEKIKCEVEGLLRQSLTRFLQLAFTNAGRSHDNIAYGVCAIYLAAALATSISLIVGRKPRALRLVVIPMLIIAWSALFANLNGICTAIYAFGDARQLYPYELFIIRCRAYQGTPYARPVDYKALGAGMVKVGSAEPIIQPHTVYRPKRPDDFAHLDKVRRLLPGWAKKREVDLEQGESEQGEHSSFESTPVSTVSYRNNPPSFPAPAYIPTSPHSTLQQSFHIQNPARTPVDEQPINETNDNPGAFCITALNPKIPPRPPNWGSEEERLLRAVDLDIGDPRALGVYGPMVSVPNELVRRVHRDIWVRTWWMAAGLSVVIVAALMCIPVPS